MNEKLKSIMDEFESLKRRRANIDPMAKEIIKFICPFRGRMVTGKPDQKINTMLERIRYMVDETPLRCFQVAANGIHSGITPPSRPWKRLAFADDGLNDYGSAKRWLDDLNRKADNLMRRSNFYSAAHDSYSEDVAFANSCIGIRVDPELGLRFKTLTWGEWWVGLDANGNPSTLYRSCWMSALQAAERFGEA